MILDLDSALAEARRLCEEVWHADWGGEPQDIGTYNREYPNRTVAHCYSAQDAADIVRVRALMPRLLVEVEALRADRERLVKAIAGYRHWFDTCTRTNAYAWEDKAARASEELDAALDIAMKGTK